MFFPRAFLPDLQPYLTPPLFRSLKLGVRKLASFAFGEYPIKNAVFQIEIMLQFSTKFSPTALSPPKIHKYPNYSFSGIKSVEL